MTPFRTYLTQHRTLLISVVVLTSPLWIGLIVNHVIFRLPSTHNEILAGHSALVRALDEKLYKLTYDANGNAMRDEVPDAYGAKYEDVYEWVHSGIPYGEGDTIKERKRPQNIRSTVAILSTGAVVYANTDETSTTYRIWKYENGTTTLVRSYPILDFMKFSREYANGTVRITPEVQAMTSNTYEMPFMVFPDNSIGFLDYMVMKGNEDGITQTALRLRVVDVYGVSDKNVILAESKDEGPRYAMKEVEGGRVRLGRDGMWGIYSYIFPHEDTFESDVHFDKTFMTPLSVTREKITFLGSYVNYTSRGEPFRISEPIRIICGTERDFDCTSEKAPIELLKEYHDDVTYDKSYTQMVTRDDEYLTFNDLGSKIIHIEDAFHYFPIGGCTIPQGSWMPTIQLWIPFCFAYSRNALQLTEGGETHTIYAYDEVIAQSTRRLINLISLSQDKTMAVVYIWTDVGQHYYSDDTPEIASTYAYDIANDKWALLTDNPSERVLYLR